MKKKTKIFIVEGVLLLLVVSLGVTYAFFSIGDKQTLANSFSSGCLRITIENETNSISLNNTYPVSDVEGLSNSPYTFTIKNTCSKSTNYEINLESINGTSNSLNPSYIKVSLSSNTFDNKVSILGSNETRKYYSSNSYASFHLYTGSIEGNTTKTFNLREWIDYDTTVSQGASKTYTSKINVIANPDLNVVATPEIKTTYVNKVLTGTINGNPSSISYCTSTGNVCTPNTALTMTDNEVKIDLENNRKEQIVCTKLDNTTYCSNPVLVTEADLNILAINLKQSNGTYQETDKVPTSGYILNTENTTCEVNGTADTSVTITYDEGNLTFNGLKKNTKCYLYFDVILAKDIILANIPTITTRSSFSSTVTASTTGTIYTAEDAWYDSNLASYAGNIDTNAGFCNDRQPSTTMGSSNGSGGTGTTTTYYGAFIRMFNSSGNWANPQVPTYKCQNSSDLFTLSSSSKGNKALSKPIGLITVDEVVYGGGFGGSNNTSYYLYTGQHYWTMSPYFFYNSRAYMFIVGSDGYPAWVYVNNSHGVRPVINLKSDTVFSQGTGTSSNPYIVN